MNRIPPANAIPTDFILDSDEAQYELHQREWSIGHTVIDSVHQVYCHKEEVRIVANAPTELTAWLLACEKANEQDRMWKDRN